MSIRICVVEDDPRISEGLTLLFSASEGFVCEACYQTAEAALAELPRVKPDVVLMDINLPGLSGIGCVRRLKNALPETQVLMLTAYEDSEKIFQSLIAGASGYLLKRTSKEELLRAITEVREGGAPLTSNIARKVVEYFQQSAHAASELASLTEREREILDYLARGYLYKEIAAQLAIAFDTVQWHIRNIYQKLHVRSRSQAIAKYLKD